MTEIDPRILAVAAHTGYDADAYTLELQYGDTYTVTDGGAEYLVLTDEEADEAVRESILGSLWAFNAQFLADYTELPVEVFQGLQGLYDDANEPIRKLVERADDGIDGFVDEAVSADGRGHFLASHDSEEVSAGEFYLYRIN